MSASWIAVSPSNTSGRRPRLRHHCWWKNRRTTRRAEKGRLSAWTA